ncbi:hypothetical protein FACS189472_08640 [Alphaproteobacteria bacterium]|nr:hypothetical protein FACS189472_08640 [Alphaproteobacteria bacterium]
MLNQIQKILAVNEIGSVNQILQKSDPRAGVVEGIGKYSYLTCESTTPKPYDQAQEIVIPLTNANVDIVEFHRSFFTLNLDILLTFNCDVTKIAPLGYNDNTGLDCRKAHRKCDLFFIGFKDAIDCIESCRLQQNGIDLGSTIQNRASIESFLYNQMKPQTEEGNKHGSYSLWDDAVKGDESICGIYLTYEELSALTVDNNKIRVQFPVTIGFDMLLPLQGFNLSLNALFGDLTLVIKTNLNALVWCCISH